MAVFEQERKFLNFRFVDTRRAGLRKKRRDGSKLSTTKRRELSVNNDDDVSKSDKGE